MWVRTILLVTLMTAATPLPDVTIHLYPNVIFAGQAARITCRVRPDHDNRGLQMGFTDYLSDGFQLDGEDSRITWQATFEHIPCNPGDAFCAVTRRTGLKMVHMTLAVHGCDPIQ